MPFEEVALAEVSRASADAPDALRSYRKGNMGKNAFLGTRRILAEKDLSSFGLQGRRIEGKKHPASIPYASRCL